MLLKDESAEHGPEDSSGYRPERPQLRPHDQRGRMAFRAITMHCATALYIRYGTLCRQVGSTKLTVPRKLVVLPGFCHGDHRFKGVLNERTQGAPAESNTVLFPSASGHNSGPKPCLATEPHALLSQAFARLPGLHLLLLTIAGPWKKLAGSRGGEVMPRLGTYGRTPARGRTETMFCNLSCLV